MKLSKTQIRILTKFDERGAMTAYEAQENISHICCLVGKGLLKNVTKNSAGVLFSPRTHFEFKRTRKSWKCYE